MAQAHKFTVEVSASVFDELTRIAGGAPEAYVRRLVEETVTRQQAREQREALMAERAKELAEYDLAICKEFEEADDEVWARMEAEERNT